MRAPGVHIIAELNSCDLSQFAADQSQLTLLSADVSKLLQEFSLVELGSYYHFFGPHAATAVVCLAESHITFHSWPEDNYVSFDIFICHSSAERQQIAEQVLEFFVNRIFHAKDVRKTFITR